MAVQKSTRNTDLQKAVLWRQVLHFVSYLDNAVLLHNASSKLHPGQDFWPPVRIQGQKIVLARIFEKQGCSSILKRKITKKEQS